MFKMEIVFDEAKVKQNGTHSTEMLYKAVDDIMEAEGILRLDKGYYKGPGTRQDFGRFGNVIYTLSRVEWFVKHAAAWYLFESKGQADRDEDYSYEDVIESLVKMGEWANADNKVYDRAPAFVQLSQGV